MRMLVDSSDDQRIADPSLLRIIARAHNVHGRLSQNTKLTVHDIAREEGVTAAYLFNLLRLPWLAPDITTAIVNGRPPHQLNAKVLMRKAPRLPADWLRSACCSDSKGSPLHGDNFVTHVRIDGSSHSRCRSISIKSVNHEMAPERFSLSRAPGERAHLSLRPVTREKCPPIGGKIHKTNIPAISIT
jgi:hypothetical protein